MNPVVIDIQNLGKKYQLGGDFQLDQTLGEMLSDRVKRLWGRLRTPWASAPTTEPGMAAAAATSPPPTNASRGSFWALKDINFQVRQGEVIGIIGCNGAGKSTLLKILSEITEPTHGQVRIRGQVASLLEVGTGFHPELTGRENIYLNGAILGMTRKEISDKFDQIVAYSGIGTFIDTPVKRYSSGMSVRLAFSVAAHLEPDILIVDEVLAVGDAEFQKRCIGRMQQVAGTGRTVLFVSHNMAAVQALCTRAILLKDGQLIADDKPQAVIRQYLDHQAAPTQNLQQRTDRTGTGEAQLLDCRITGPGNSPVQINQPWEIRLRYRTQHPGDRHDVSVYLSTADNPRVSFLATDMLRQAPQHWPAQGEIVLKPQHPCTLWPGTYSLSLAMHHRGLACDVVTDAANFDVVLGEQTVFDSMGKYPATLLLPAAVQVHPLTKQNSQTRPDPQPRNQAA